MFNAISHLKKMFIINNNQQVKNSAMVQEVKTQYHSP